MLRWPGHSGEGLLSPRNGIADYVRDRRHGERTPVHQNVVRLASEEERLTPVRQGWPISVDVALQWTAWNGKTDEAERVHSFANVISTTDGGTHVEGLKAALTWVCQANLAPPRGADLAPPSTVENSTSA